LRDVTPTDADLFDDIRRREQTDGGFNDFGLEPQPVDRMLLARGPLRDEHNGVMLVEHIADGAVIGSVGWRRVRYGPNRESDAWMIGIELEPGGPRPGLRIGGPATGCRLPVRDHEPEPGRGVHGR